MQINAYLNFDGQCETAFQFYEQVFGGKIQGVFRFAGTPMENQVPPEWREKIMHVTLKAGDNVLMGTDVPPAHNQGAPRGFAMTVGVSDAAEAERIFHALSEGGTVRMPLQQTFWAIRYGMVVDRFGIPWMINCEAAA